MAKREKKDSNKSVRINPGRPKSGLDETFLSLADHVMMTHGIKSPSALSKELGKGVDFISKIRRGLQSAPPDAWDALYAMYPETRNITNNVTVNGGGQAVGTVRGDNAYAPPANFEVCQRELAGARAEIERLQQQVAANERLIASMEKNAASQEEIISLLRGSVNRPN